MWVWQTEPEFLNLKVTPQLEQKKKKYGKSEWRD